MSVWVVDASPLLYLAHLDRLQLLRAEGREVVLPSAVLDEVRSTLRSLVLAEAGEAD